MGFLGFVGGHTAGRVAPFWDATAAATPVGKTMPRGLSGLNRKHVTHKIPRKWTK
jgi:hypothetical protein